MYVNGVATAPVQEIEYQDGWIRTFKKIPKFTDQEKELFADFMVGDDVQEMLIYLGRFRGITGDDAEFVVREFVRGNI